jgi:hypothetical protein
MVLAGEPAFYLLPHISDNLSFRYMSYVDFHRTIEVLEQAGVEHGPISALMFQRVQSAAVS